MTGPFFDEHPPGLCDRPSCCAPERIPGGKEIIAPITGYQMFLLGRFGGPATTQRTVKNPDKCFVPNPENPNEECDYLRSLHGPEHSWWYCTSEYGDYGSLPALPCELKRGHDGDHEGHWS